MQNRGRVPASEQSEPEPRKYTGGSIPSRSFRMLQAMTALDPNGEFQKYSLDEIILLFLLRLCLVLLDKIIYIYSFVHLIAMACGYAKVFFVFK